MAKENRGLAGVIDAYFEGRESKQKLKNETDKIKLQFVLRAMEKQAAQKQAQKQALEMDAAKNPANYSPEQRFLKRRALEENPLLAMAVPEEGQDMEGIGMPTGEITENKAGLLQRTPVSKDRQAQLLEQKVQQMLAQGKKPHPAIIKLLQLQRANRQGSDGKGPAYDPMTGKANPDQKKDADKIDKIGKIARTKNALIRAKYGDPAFLDDEQKQEMANDPDLKWLDKQLNELQGVTEQGSNVPSGEEDYSRLWG